MSKQEVSSNITQDDLLEIQPPVKSGSSTTRYMEYILLQHKYFKHPYFCTDDLILACHSCTFQSPHQNFAFYETMRGPGLMAARPVQYLASSSKPRIKKCNHKHQNILAQTKSQKRRG